MSDVFGLSLHTPMARSLVNTGAFEKMSDVPCDVNMFSQQAFLIHGDVRNNFRPSLVIQGRARSAILHLENEEQTVLFSADEDNCPYVSFIYEFSEKELKAMIDAGYYTENFQIPDIFIKNVFEQMPAPCDIYVLSEDAREPDDTPVILFDTSKWYGVVTDGEKSGYEDLSDAFERHEPESNFEDINEIQEESVTDAEYIDDNPDVEAEAEVEAEPKEEHEDTFESIMEQAARIQKRVEKESEKYKADIAAANETAEEETEVVSENVDANDDEDDDDPKSSKKKHNARMNAKHNARMNAIAQRLGNVDQREEVAETEAETEAEIVEASDIDAAF